MTIRATSAEVYHRITNEGLLSRRRLQVYDILYHHGPLVGTVIAQKMAAMGVRGFSENVRNRLTELRDLGVVKECGEVTDPVTGNIVILWDVTDQLPRKINPLDIPPTKKELIEALCLQIEEIQAAYTGKTNISEKAKVWLERTNSVLRQCARHRKQKTSH